MPQEQQVVPQEQQVVPQEQQVVPQVPQVPQEQQEQRVHRQEQGEGELQHLQQPRQPQRQGQQFVQREVVPQALRYRESSRSAAVQRQHLLQLHAQLGQQPLEQVQYPLDTDRWHFEHALQHLRHFVKAFRRGEYDEQVQLMLVCEEVCFVSRHSDTPKMPDDRHDLPARSL